MHDLVERHDFSPAPAALEAGPFQRVARNAFPFIVVGALWEALAHLGLFPPRLFPPLEAIAAGGPTQAEYWLARYRGDWHGDVSRIFAEAAI